MTCSSWMTASSFAARMNSASSTMAATIGKPRPRTPPALRTMTRRRTRRPSVGLLKMIDLVLSSSVASAFSLTSRRYCEAMSKMVRVVSASLEKKTTVGRVFFPCLVRSAVSRRKTE